MIDASICLPLNKMSGVLPNPQTLRHNTTPVSSLNSLHSLDEKNSLNFNDGQFAAGAWLSSITHHRAALATCSRFTKVVHKKENTPHFLSPEVHAPHQLVTH